MGTGDRASLAGWADPCPPHSTAVGLGARDAIAAPTKHPAKQSRVPRDPKKQREQRVNPIRAPRPPPQVLHHPSAVLRSQLHPLSPN